MKDLTPSLPSINGLGKGLSRLSRVTDEEERKRLLAESDSWWQTGDTI